MRDQLERIGRRFITEVQRDDVAGLAAELAYRFLFAVFPFGIFLAALGAFVARWVGIDDPTASLMSALGDNLPRDVAQTIRPQLEAVIGTTRPELLSFGAAGAIWAATGGTGALIKAMNRAYEVEETRPTLRRYALAVGLTVLAGAGVLVAFVSIVGGSLLTQRVAEQLGIGAATFATITVLRWPLVFVLLAGAVGVLYHLAPNIRTPWRWCFAGGALFAVVWLVATFGFALYVANFGHYDATYGTLGGVIVLLLWFYLSAFVLVAAAELVAVAMKELAPDFVEQGRRDARAATNAAGEAADRTGEAASELVVRGRRAARTALSHPRRGDSVMAAAHPVSPVAISRDVLQRIARGDPRDRVVALAVTGLGLVLGAVAARLAGPRDR